LPKEPKAGRTPAQKAFDKWWSKPENRRKTWDKRKERYKNDLEYREKVKERVYKRRRDYRAKNPAKGRGHNIPKKIELDGQEVTLLSSGDVAERFGVSRATILRWEKSEVLPRLFIRDEHERRWYHEDNVSAITKILEIWRKSNNRSLSFLTERVKGDIGLIVDLPDTFSIGETYD